MSNLDAFRVKRGCLGVNYGFFSTSRLWVHLEVIYGCNLCPIRAWMSDSTESS